MNLDLQPNPNPEDRPVQVPAEAGQEIFVVIGAFALILLLVIWGAAYHVINLEREAAEDSAIHSSQELLETYKSQIVRNLGAIDQTLKIVKFSFELRDNHFSLSELREKGLLPSSVVFDVRVADAGGNIVGKSSPEEAPSIASQPYFTAHRQFDSGKPYIGVSSWNDKTRQWELQFSRRLNKTDGEFDGVVVLTVDPAYFISGYEQSRFGEHGVLGLLGQHGEILVMRTGDNIDAGGKLAGVAGAETVTSLADGHPRPNPWDNINRYTAMDRLSAFPLIALVGLSQEEQLTEYRNHKRAYLWQAAIASLLLAATLAFLARLSHQLNNSRSRIRKIQETYHAASEASVDAFYLLRSIHASDGAIIDLQLSDTNRRGEILLGVQKATLEGTKLGDLFPGSVGENFLADLIAVARDGVIHEKEWFNTGTTLRAEWLYRQVVPVEDGVVVILRDISERKRLETKVQFQATHDALTGLANRTLLLDRLNQAIAQTTRSERGVWVILIDLDRFKSVNDSLGHKAGDIVLTAISERLRTIVRDSDTVARLGGDEFVLVLPEIGESKLSANTLLRIMQTISSPIPIGEKEFSFNCSMGVAAFPNDGDTAAQLIERADIAMYRAKETGRGKFQFFTAEMNERLIERMRIEEAMRDAIEREEFELAYQPQVDLQTGLVIGAEALIRWRHPELGLVSPARFIPLAEETGLIIPIGQWVLHTACKQTVEWERAGLGKLRMAVNLSARQFTQPELVESIAGALDEVGLDAEQLEIELTEGLVMTDVENAIETLHDLKKLGVQLAIDDFGTGYSSLSYLKRFPIDVLKIDQSFVRDITNLADQATIVQTIISMAHNLGLRVIAEGVETEVQLAYLRRYYCHEIQGYYFSKPLPAVEFAQLLKEKKTLQVELADGITPI